MFREELDLLTAVKVTMNQALTGDVLTPEEKEIVRHNLDTTIRIMEIIFKYRTIIRYVQPDFKEEGE